MLHLFILIYSYINKDLSKEEVSFHFIYNYFTLIVTYCNSLSLDSNKFGQKMLEKMGWSNGKGLGAQEQGIVEHIRVKVKNDQVGEQI
jgi:hypothetical protein